MDESSVRTTLRAANPFVFLWLLLLLGLFACTEVRLEGEGHPPDPRRFPSRPGRVVNTTEPRPEEALLATVGEKGLCVLSPDGERVATVELSFDEFESARIADLAFDPWGDRLLVVFASDETEGSAVLSVSVGRSPWSFGEVTRLASSDGRLSVLALRSGAVLFEESMGTRARFIPRGGEVGASVPCPMPLSLERGSDGDGFIATGRAGEPTALLRIDAVSLGDRLSCESAQVAPDAPTLGIASILGEEWLLGIVEGELTLVDEMANRFGLGVTTERVEQVVALEDRALVLVPGAVIEVWPSSPESTIQTAFGPSLTTWDVGPHKQIAVVKGRTHVATTEGLLVVGRSTEGEGNLTLTDASVRSPIVTIW